MYESNAPILENVAARNGETGAGKDRIAKALPALASKLREGDRRGLLVALDAGALMSASAAAFSLAGQPWPLAGFASLAATAVGVATLYSLDDYGLGSRRGRVAAVSAAAAAMGAVSVGTLSFGWPGVSGTLAPVLVFGAVALWAARGISSAVLARWLVRPTWVVGTADEIRGVVEELSRHPLAGLFPAGTSEPRAAASHHDSPGGLVVLCRSALDRLHGEARLAHASETMAASRLYEVLGRRLPARSLDERWFLEHFSSARSMFYEASKRVLDILAAVAGLALFIPFLPIVALAIWLEDRGPVFYGQVRVGKDGRPFRMYKLRSMRTDAEKGRAVWAAKDDPRVTRIGKFLRRSRLDEVPQLFNVLRGDLSLVGPRPERPEFVTDLARQIPHYELRHRIKPGVTGWAQVRYPYGASVADAEEKLGYDLYYIKHRNLVLDLLIVVRTVAVVLGRIGSR